jgi:EAL domain-containing protein (putative c-di-GMP-specific phosphodiesterase class I)
MKQGSFANALTEAVRGKNESPETVLPMLLAAIREFFGMEIAFISHFSAGRRYFVYVDSEVDEPKVKIGGSDPLIGSYCKAVVDGDLPELIGNAQVLSQARSIPATTAFPVGAHMSVPLVLSSGEVYGTFCCFSRSPNETLNGRDLNLVRVFANIAADILGRKADHELHVVEVRERLEGVLRDGQLGIVLQPIYNIVDNRVVGFESLSRFYREPYRSPDLWFHDAMEVGLHNKLEMLAIEKALTYLEHLPEGTYLSVNISPKVLFEKDIRSLFGSVPLPRIVLEITEHEIVENYERLLGILKPLRERGLRIAVDDAGAGFSSLRHILQIGPEIIKLDISITRAIDRDERRRSLAAGLISFANATAIKLIAEGVDSPKELDTLKEIGAIYSQGYLLAKPMTVSQLVEANLWR